MAVLKVGMTVVLMVEQKAGETVVAKAGQKVVLKVENWGDQKAVLLAEKLVAAMVEQ